MPFLSSVVPRLVRARSYVGAELSARAMLSMANLARLTPHANPARHGVTVMKDIAYVDDGATDHLLDVYRPKAPAPPGGWPMIFYVHGGGFRWLSKDTHWLMGLMLARHGFVVVMPNHRLAPLHRFPAHLEDSALALAFAVDRAASFDADATRLVLAGESAGANLATSLALCIAYERDEPYAQLVRSLGVQPLAVLAACGIFEVTNARRFLQHVNWFLRDRFLELEASYPQQRDGCALGHDLLDPLCLLERAPPKRPLPAFFLPVGDKDPLIGDTVRMEAALRKHGAHVEAPVYPGEGHAFHAIWFRAQARRCWEDHVLFLRARIADV